MKRYIRIFITLLRLNVETLIVYPANFYNSLIASTAWGFFSIYSIVLLTSQTQGAFGWKREEILLLNGIYNFLIGIFHVVFSRNFERFASVIHLGHLDSVLTKPVDSQFLLSFWLFGWVSISRVLIALGYIAIIWNSLRLSVSLSDIVIFIFLGLSGLLLLYSVWYIIITITIWFSRLSNLVELMFNITGVARYPRTMFTEASSYALWILGPMLFIINTPTKVLLHRLHAGEVIVLISLSILVFWISRFFWRYALRSYSSASS